MKYDREKIIGITVLCGYIIFLIVYLSMKEKNMEYFESEPRETFYHALVRNKEIDILEVIRSINYENRQVTGFVGQNIIYKIYSTLKEKDYIIMRYPDFRNEIKRHSKSYFDKYFQFIEHQFVELNKNYIFDFTGFHGIIDNKVRIWVKLMEKYDRAVANEIMGTTYLIPNDKQLFMNNYVNGGKYILKNSYGGARSALKITNEKEEILHYFDTTSQNPANCEDAVCHSKVKYNIVQKYIEPTFLMKGLKFGLRMFEKLVRMSVFLSLPAIAWENKGSFSSLKKAVVVIKKHPVQFLSSYALTGIAAALLTIPLIPVAIAAKADIPIPQIVWLGVIIYSGLTWALGVYLEQMSVGLLYLWHYKWEKAGGEGDLTNITKPDLLDDIHELR